MSERRRITLNVGQMTCEGCANAVARVARKADPDAEVAVDLSAGRVDITTSVGADALAAVITKAGYPASPA